MATKARRGSPAITAASRAKFIETLRLNGNVSQAARVSGFDQSTAYQLRLKDENFAEAWRAALAEATDSLELEAFRRGRDGVPKLVVSMGKIVYVPGDNDGKPVPLIENVYSDAILLRLLQAHKPDKYNPPPQSVTNVTIPAELLPDPVPTPDEAGPEKPVL